MQPAMLRGYRRRSVKGNGYAAMATSLQMYDAGKITDWEPATPQGAPEGGGLVLGQVVTGLLPFERRLLDGVIDDSFQMVNVRVQHVDNQDWLSKDGPYIDCVTYVWREELIDAMQDSDWDMLDFSDKWLPNFLNVCADVALQHKIDSMSNEELQEMALARRRAEGDPADEGSYHSEEEDEDA